MIFSVKLVKLEAYVLGFAAFFCYNSRWINTVCETRRHVPRKIQINYYTRNRRTFPLMDCLEQATTIKFLSFHK